MLNTTGTAMAAITNHAGYTGSIAEAMVGADVYIGLSAGHVAEADVAKMAPESMIFAMANPEPEIHPDVARRYARVIATGLSIVILAAVNGVGSTLNTRFVSINSSLKSSGWLDVNRIRWSFASRGSVSSARSSCGKFSSPSRGPTFPMTLWSSRGSRVFAFAFPLPNEFTF